MNSKKPTKELDDSTSDSNSSDCKVAVPYEDIRHLNYITIPSVKQEKAVAAAD